TGPDGKKRNGKRVELRREEDQIEWLRRKGNQGGFELLAAKISPGVPDVRAVSEPGLGKVTGQRASGREGGKIRPVTLASVLFEGHLRVTDSEKFLNISLAQGIGSGKAYGFGLLSIAPPMR
ncbi:MAG: type I-E CRISPR-associated protein Cas6/Cse3/CasE, partial [candidate division Zixibacteria bacterium]|nr:type I-E CRISPR-associated protein Cas6/Cse3/CasE [candidate division Zixibacteria bacterium]